MLLDCVILSAFVSSTPLCMVRITQTVFMGLVGSWDPFHTQAAVLAVSSANKSNTIGFVGAFTRMMDCDRTTPSCWVARRWSGVSDSLCHCWERRWWMISPRFSSTLSELLDNPGDLWRSLLYFLTPGHNQGYCMLFPVRFINRNITAKQSRKLCSVFNNRLPLNKPN